MWWEPVDWNMVAKRLLLQLTLDHPLPWVVDSDWSYEVKASDGHVVARCMDANEATTIVNVAENVRKELADLDRIMDLSYACKEVAPEVDCDQILNMSLDEALGFAFTLLGEKGVEDPEAFLRERNILEVQQEGK